MMKRHLWAALLCAAFFCAVSCREDIGVKTEFSHAEYTRAAEALVGRITGGREDEFRVVVTGVQQDGKDWFSLYSENGKIVLEGNSGISVASALNHYLKTYCGWHYTWCGKDTELPEVLPLPEEKVTKVSPYKYRYYLNYCTFNYSMSWWDYDRWRQEIDFMALNGINMPLAVTGQNSVWQRVYRRLGFTDSQLESFFSGPAYFNWFWMGNLDGWGGPLPQSFMDRHEELQRNILFAERSLGMTPILPAFTGHVPPAFPEMFPDAKVRRTSWVNFPEVAILDPDEELFTEIGRMFIEEQTKIYGTDHYYTADTFNENLPPLRDSSFLSGMSGKVYSSMSGIDPEAVWVMQGWLFYYARSFWGEKEIRALLSAVPDDRMLLLDLWSECFPVWNRTEAYYGKPWIWCMLHNFGQNITMSGNAENVAKGPSEALHSPLSGKMQGIGLTMEGIGQNPAMYALMLENVWRDTPVDIDTFIGSYFGNRYGCNDGSAEEAWKIIFRTAFENGHRNGGHRSIIEGRPTFASSPGGAISIEPHYDPRELVRAWDLLISSSGKLSGRDGYRYDLVDVTRQVLADWSSSLHREVVKAYRSGSPEDFRCSASRFMELISDMDRLLSTREEFLLGRWLESAKAMGTSPQEKSLYERNARNLLTLWGDRDCPIRDYASRQWSGLMNGFYGGRWRLFFDMAYRYLTEGKDMDDFDSLCREWEWDWIHGTETYPDRPCGDETEVCLGLYEKYRRLMYPEACE